MPSPGTRTIGRGQSLSRFTLHGRGVVVHGGKLIVPTISDADTSRPEIVAPPAVDPTDGRTSVTAGAGPDGARGGSGMTVDGEPGNPDE